MRSTALPARLICVWLALACCACGSAPSSSSSTSSATPSTTTPTTPTFACSESTSDPLEIALRRCHDLNGDGVIDSKIDTSNNLLRLTGAVSRDITLNGFAATARIASVTSVGQYVGGPLSEVVVRVNDSTSDSFFTVLYVVDPEAGTEVARWTQPFRTPTWVWVGFPLTTGKLRIPIIAPGQEQANVTWN